MALWCWFTSGARGGRVPECFLPLVVCQFRPSAFEVVRLVPQARVQRVGEHIVDAPDDAGETVWMHAFSEIEEKCGASETGGVAGDRDAGDAGEADRINTLLEVVEAHGETDRMDVGGPESQWYWRD